MARPATPDLRDRLLEASAGEFAAKGFDVAKIQDITRLAGTSKASFYLHFASKAEAVEELVRTFLAGIDELVNDDDSFLALDLGVDAVPLIFDGLLAKNIRIHRYLWRERTIAKLVFEGAQSARFAHLTGALMKRSHARLPRFIAWGVRCGFFRDDIDIELSSQLIIGGYDQLARDLVARRSTPDFDHIFRSAQRVLFGGILTPAARTMLDEQRDSSS